MEHLKFEARCLECNWPFFVLFLPKWGTRKLLTNSGKQRLPLKSNLLFWSPLQVFRRNWFLSGLADFVKNILSLQDSNSDRRSRRRGRWPIDHHHGPTFGWKVHSWYFLAWLWQKIQRIPKNGVLVNWINCCWAPSCGFSDTPLYFSSERKKNKWLTNTGPRSAAWFLK